MTQIEDKELLKLQEYFDTNYKKLFTNGLQKAFRRGSTIFCYGHPHATPLILNERVITDE